LISFSLDKSALSKTGALQNVSPAPAGHESYFLRNQWTDQLNSRGFFLLLAPLKTTVPMIKFVWSKCGKKKPVFPLLWSLTVCSQKLTWMRRASYLT